jgi:hypothetical protein
MATLFPHLAWAAIVIGLDYQFDGLNDYTYRTFMALVAGSAGISVLQFEARRAWRLLTIPAGVSLLLFGITELIYRLVPELFDQIGPLLMGLMLISVVATIAFGLEVVTAGRIAPLSFMGNMFSKPKGKRSDIGDLLNEAPDSLLAAEVELTRAEQQAGIFERRAATAQLTLPHFSDGCQLEIGRF